MTIPMPPDPPRSANGWATIIRDIGFPIVVALFLLYQIPSLASALDKLTITLKNVDETLVEQLSELRKHRARTERNSSPEEEE